MKNNKERKRVLLLNQESKKHSKSHIENIIVDFANTL